MLRILLVEDEANDATLIERALRRGDFANALDWSQDGEDALNYLLRRERHADKQSMPLPGLILLDLKLPKLSGLELLEKIKSTENLRRIPVVVLTSSAEPGDIDQAYEFGTNSFLTKPVSFADFAELTQLIGRYWLRGNQPPPAVSA